MGLKKFSFKTRFLLNLDSAGCYGSIQRSLKAEWSLSQTFKSLRQKLSRGRSLKIKLAKMENDELTQLLQLLFPRAHLSVQGRVRSSEPRISSRKMLLFQNKETRRKCGSYSRSKWEYWRLTWRFLNTQPVSSLKTFAFFWLYQGHMTKERKWNLWVIKLNLCSVIDLKKQMLKRWIIESLEGPHFNNRGEPEIDWVLYIYKPALIQFKSWS